MDGLKDETLSQLKTTSVLVGLENLHWCLRYTTYVKISFIPTHDTKSKVTDSFLGVPAFNRNPDMLFGKLCGYKRDAQRIF